MKHCMVSHFMALAAIFCVGGIGCLDEHVSQVPRMGMPWGQIACVGFGLSGVCAVGSSIGILYSAPGASARFLNPVAQLRFNRMPFSDQVKALEVGLPRQMVWGVRGVAVAVPGMIVSLLCAWKGRRDSRKV